MLLFIRGDLHQVLGWPVFLQAVGPPLPGSHFWRLPEGGCCVGPMAPPHFLFLASQSPDVSFNGGNTTTLSLRVLGSNSIFVTEGASLGGP